MLSFLDLPYEGHNVAGSEREHESAEFLQLNPFGQVPVLIDGKVILRDSQAILAYLASAYGSTTWWPTGHGELGQVVSWLSTAANEVARGPALLRMHYRFGRPIDVPAAQMAADQLLDILEDHLSNRDWLVGSLPSVADVAMYPYIALAPEADLDLSFYPAVCRWLLRFQALPHYLHMSGMWEPAQQSANH